VVNSQHPRTLPPRDVIPYCVQFGRTSMASSPQAIRDLSSLEPDEKMIFKLRGSDTFVSRGTRGDAMPELDLRRRNGSCRWHNPASGCWIRRDPGGFAMGDVNLFQFCNNAPTDATDASGLQPTPGIPSPPAPTGSETITPNFVPDPGTDPRQQVGLIGLNTRILQSISQGNRFLTQAEMQILGRIVAYQPPPNLPPGMGMFLGRVRELQRAARELVQTQLAMIFAAYAKEKSADAATRAQIAQSISELGAKEYAVREAAERTLVRTGNPLYVAARLVGPSGSSDPEIKQRAERVMAALRRQGRAPDPGVISGIAGGISSF
jgi:RHS repeat-associated protein